MEKTQLNFSDFFIVARLYQKSGKTSAACTPLAHEPNKNLSQQSSVKTFYFLKTFILSILLLMIGKFVQAQVVMQSYLDLGENYVSEGIVLRNGLRGTYRYQAYKVEAGVQLDWISRNPHTLYAFDFQCSRNFLVKDFRLDLVAFLMTNRFSDLLYETNWGARIETKNFDHLLLGLGLNNKSYTIRSSVRDEFGIDAAHSRVSEYLNLMYIISAYLNPHPSKWNIGISCTNYDYYRFHQSTNPLFNLQLRYKPRPNICLQVDSWYQAAGILNISASYFGYFFRGGVKWEI